MKPHIFLLPSLLVFSACSRPSSTYPVHENITATLFWVGETPQKGAANGVSAWDEHWHDHYGGTDDPKYRNGYFPIFPAHENPFYIALPYNDLAKGGRKHDAMKIVPWASHGGTYSAWQSVCKNRWVKLCNGPTTCYAQWEDVGPFETDDSAYVFGPATARPKNHENQNAGIDFSPACSLYLHTGGMGKVSWQFVEAADVPSGPWTQTVTGEPPPTLPPLP